MSNDRPIYVIDTNIIVDYVDIIPNGSDKQPVEPTIDLSHAHIVIPTAVIRELSSFKKEKSERAKAGREALRRIRVLLEDQIKTIDEVYQLEAPIEVKNGKQLFSVLPVHKNFKKCLPFSPSEDDMDGQIILAGLIVGFLLDKLPIDGTATPAEVGSFKSDDVVILTNDNGLATRARSRGLKTKRYGYKHPEPYTGRRDVVVPQEVFCEFYNCQRLDLDYWEKMMPEQPKLIANEFIVMSLADKSEYPKDFDPSNNPYFCNIGRYDSVEKAIVKLKYARGFPIRLHNAGQAIYAEALMDPGIAAIICTGPAGSGKTYMATVYGYHACKAGEFIGVTVVPCDIKSNLGALPGDLDEKMDPDVKPLKKALKNYLLKEEPKFKKELETLRKYGVEAKKKSKAQSEDDDCPEKKSIKSRLKDRVDLIWDNWFTSIPIEYARGEDFSHELAIYDEFQDQTVKQADTLIKRLGDDGKIIITGDVEQIHAPYIDTSNTGLIYASEQLRDSPMVAQVCFTEDEVIRHPLVKMIAKRQKSSDTGD